MSDELPRSVREAQDGDLRPQVNPHAPANLLLLPENLAELEPVLIDRFLQLARPIGDASAGGGPELRLQDAGPFFYLIEALKRLHFPDLEQTLCILLDEFAALDERSYDELYLWCLVELARTDVRHVETYWPQVLTLDLHYRSALWTRPAGTHLVEQPYRLTDLVFWYYAIYTPRKYHYAYGAREAVVTLAESLPSLGSRLERIAVGLSDDQAELACRALRELAAVEPHRTVFSDALGLLTARRRRKPAPNTDTREPPCTA
jgi:hypothetical protein